MQLSYKELVDRALRTRRGKNWEAVDWDQTLNATAEDVLYLIEQAKEQESLKAGTLKSRDVYHVYRLANWMGSLIQEMSEANKTRVFQFLLGLKGRSEDADEVFGSWVRENAGVPDPEPISLVGMSKEDIVNANRELDGLEPIYSDALDEDATPGLDDINQ